MLEILLDKLEAFLDKYSFISVIAFFVGWIWVSWLMILAGILLAIQVGIPDLKELIAGLVSLTVTEE